METVGIIGCGLMGKGIVKNFVSSQYKVLVYDPDPNTVKWIHENGAFAVDSLKELSMEATIVISSLPTVGIIKESYLGNDGVFHFIKEGSIIIDMSTADANTAIQLAGEAKKRNLHFFDCPVSGGPDGARNGTLTIMAGGDKEKFDEILPILKVVGKEIFYLGENGSGQTAKLCHNMVVASMVVSLGEAFVVASKAGLAPKKLAEVLSKGAATRVLDVYGANILNGDYDNVLFSLNHMHKDVSLYSETASSLQVPSFIGSMVFQLFETAKATSKGQLDTSAVCQVIEELSSATIKEKSLIS